VSSNQSTTAVASATDATARQSPSPAPQSTGRCFMARRSVSVSLTDLLLRFCRAVFQNGRYRASRLINMPFEWKWLVGKRDDRALPLTRRLLAIRLAQDTGHDGTERPLGLFARIGDTVRDGLLELTFSKLPRGTELGRGEFFAIAGQPLQNAINSFDIARDGLSIGPVDRRIPAAYFAIGSGTLIPRAFFGSVWDLVGSELGHEASTRAVRSGRGPDYRLSHAGRTLPAFGRRKGTARVGGLPGDNAIQKSLIGHTERSKLTQAPSKPIRVVRQAHSTTRTIRTPVRELR